MTSDEELKPEGAPERSPKAGVRREWSKRFSVQRKMAIVARLLRGEPLDLVARQTNVSIARLTAWRDRALAGAATALKESAFMPRVRPIASRRWSRYARECIGASDPSHLVWRVD